MVHGRQSELVEQRGVRLERLGMLEAGSVAAAEDVHGNRKLVAVHSQRGNSVVGEDIDELHHPVAVRAGGGGLEVDLGHAADAHGFGQDLGLVGEDVRSTLNKALVLDQPGAPSVPVVGGDGARPVGHRLRRVRGVLVELVRTRLRCRKREAAMCREIERLRLVRAALLAALRPGVEAIPAVFAGVVDVDGRGIGLGRVLLEILVEERQKDVLAEIFGRVAVPDQRAKRAPLTIDLAVEPRSHHQVSSWCCPCPWVRRPCSCEWLPTCLPGPTDPVAKALEP